MGPTQRPPSTRHKLEVAGGSVSTPPNDLMTEEVAQDLADRVRLAFGWELKPLSELLDRKGLQKLLTNTRANDGVGVVTAAAVRDQLREWAPQRLLPGARANVNERIERQAWEAADLVHVGYALRFTQRAKNILPGRSWVDLYDVSRGTPEAPGIERR